MRCNACFVKCFNSDRFGELPLVHEVMVLRGIELKGRGVILFDPPLFEENI